MKFIPSKAALASVARYLMLGTGVFAVGLVWNFPYERIRETLTSRLSKQTGYQFDVDTLSPALPLGFVAKGARVKGPAVGDMPVDLELDSLKVTLSPSTLLYPFRKIVSASFSAQRKQDEFWGSLSFGKEKSGVEFQTKNFKLTHVFPLDQLSPMLAGSNLKVTGSFTLSLELEGGTVALQRSDLSSADGKITLKGTAVTVEAPVVKTISFDTVVIDAVLQKGTVNVKSIALAGPGITAKASGTLKMEPFYIRSDLNLDAKVTVDEKAPDLRSLLAMAAAAQGLQIGPDGTLAMKVSGSLDRLALKGY